MPSEAVLKSGHDRPCRGDGQLLAGYLEDERPECIERGKLVQPGPGTETGPRVDETRENRIRVPKELPGLAIRDRSPPAGLGVDAHSLSRRSVSTIWTTSATVSCRAQSRCSSHASATQVMGCAPACTTRSRAARWASSLVPPIASTTG